MNFENSFVFLLDSPFGAATLSSRSFFFLLFFLFFEADRVYGTSKTVMAMNGGHRESKGTHSNLLIGTITYAIVFSSGKYRPFSRFVLGLRLFAAAAPCSD